VVCGAELDLLAGETMALLTVSLDPRMNAADLVSEPLRIGGVTQRARLAGAGELVLAVGLRSSHLRRYPRELSRRDVSPRS
jgi:ABC-type dipeptide/oligopeptide/nickel transport system ATPase subunit